jgi:GR25 family glycosyltransferase involved in LPS biosynthesis
MSEVKVYIISLKGSKRLKDIQKRLKQLKINFEIFYGINGHQKKNHLKLLNNYDSKKTENYIGRKLAFPEIAASLSHINIYKSIVSNKIKSSIIIEDDAYPSIDLYKWIKSGDKIKDNSILSFYSYPSGYLKKSGKKTILKNIKIHQALTHINNSSCYQINLKTCETILKITKGKVCGVADWPLNIKNNKIELTVTIPYLVIMDDYYESYTAVAREKYLSKNYLIESFNKLLIFKILKNLFHILFISFLFKKKMNYFFYKEIFFDKSIYFFKNLFLNTSLSTYTIFKNKDYYSKDLQLHRFFKIK